MHRLVLHRVRAAVMLRRAMAGDALRVVNRLPAVLARRRISWGELARRSLLPVRLVARLRTRAANPPLATAERVAAALGLTVEDLWSLAGPGSLR